MKVKELLDAPEKWTQQKFAKTASGEPTMPLDPAAVCWCLRGAIHLCYRNTDQLIEVLEKVNSRISRGLTTYQWNDAPERTFSEVKALVEELDI